MRWKAINIKPVDHNVWHRKFAFLPIRVGDEYHWLCNVYRKKMNFNNPYDAQSYWAHIPFSSFALLKQLDLEISGGFMPLEYVPKKRSIVVGVGGSLLIIFCGLIAGIVVAGIGNIVFGSY